MTATTSDQIVALLQETGREHHAAYIETDGAHPDWPLWYAEYARERMNELLQTKYTLSEWVCIFVLLDRELRKHNNTPWTEFYARELLERFAHGF